MNEGSEAPKPSIKDFLKAKAGEISEKKKEEQRQEQVGKMEDFMVEVDEKNDKMEDFMNEVDEKRDEIGGIKEQKSILTEQSLSLDESLSTIKEKVADYKQKRDVLKKTFEESLKDEELVTYFKENKIESWRDLLDKADTGETEDLKKSREEISNSVKNRKLKEDELREKHGLDSDMSGKKLEIKLKEKEVILKNQTDVLKMETPEGVQERKEELTEEINQKMEEVYKKNSYVSRIEKDNIDYKNFSQSSFLNNLTSSEIQGPEFDLLLKLNGKTETEMWSDFYKGKVEALVDKLYRKELSKEDANYLEKNKYGHFEQEHNSNVYKLKVFPVEVEPVLESISYSQSKRRNLQQEFSNKKKVFAFSEQIKDNFEKRTGYPAIISKEALDDLGEKLKNYENDYKQLTDLLKNSLEDSLGKDIWEGKNGLKLASKQMLDSSSVRYADNDKITYSPEEVINHLQTNGGEYSLKEAISNTEEREEIIKLLSKMKKTKQSFYNFNLSSVFLPENDPLVLFVKKSGGRIDQAIGDIKKTERNKEEFKRNLTESVLTHVSGEVARTEENKMREENKDLLTKRNEAEKKMTEMKNGFAQIREYGGKYSQGNNYNFKLELIDGNFTLNNQTIPEFEKVINRDEESVAEMKKEAGEVLKKTLPILGLSKANQEKAQKLAQDINSIESTIRNNKDYLEKNISYKDNALKTVNKFISELNLTEEEMEKAKDQNPIEFLYGILNDRLKKNEPTEEESKILKKIEDLKYKRSEVFPN